MNKPLDISDVTYSEEYHENSKELVSDAEYKISDQSFFIELLQILLHAKGTNYHRVNDKPKLTIALTCWDEMNTEEKPYDVLKSQLPLLLNFLESNWDKNYLNIIGLSAQGFSLTIPENKEKYQIEGPEEFGYLVLPDGTRSNDITELIEQALL